MCLQQINIIFKLNLINIIDIEKHSCENNLDCGDPWHAQCSNDNKCVCQVNNIAVNSWTCSPVIGGPCWKNHQCVVLNSFCDDYQCKCKPNFISISNDLCYPGMHTIYFPQKR